LSAPLWSEFYINGGWLLLAVGMFIVGIVVAIADSRIEVQLLTQGSIGVLGCILPFYFMMLLRGSLLQAMSYLALVVVFTLLLSIGSRASKEIPVRSAQ
jgi:hypothetical protein